MTCNGQRNTRKLTIRIFRDSPDF